MGRTIELEAADGHRLSAYVAEPDGALRGGLVVIQEIFGVNHHIRSVADDYAAQGFVTIAPALFDRVQRGVEWDYSDASIAKGREIAGKIVPDAALTDVAAALDWAKANAPGKSGVIGYCMGGLIAWLAATRLHPAAAVSYYGGRIGSFAEEQPRCPVIFHFGEKDHAIPLTDVKKVQDAHPDLSVFLYPAGHGFNCNERGSYDAESARLARLRSIDFLRKYLT
jgi:carboxymethylenebutenolidase